MMKVRSHSQKSRQSRAGEGKRRWEREEGVELRMRQEEEAAKAARGTSTH